MAEEAEAVPLPGPRKTLGRLSGRHWNTPGEGDLDWISIANPSAAGDVRYKKVLEDRSHQLEKDAPTRELNPAIKALRLKKMEGLHRHKRSKRGRGKNRDASPVRAAGGGRSLSPTLAASMFATKISDKGELAKYNKKLQENDVKRRENDSRLAKHTPSKRIDKKDKGGIAKLLEKRGGLNGTQ